MKRLKISENRRFLVWDDGTPFFWLGDTVWELFHRATIEEALLQYCARDTLAMVELRRALKEKAQTKGT